MGWHVILVRFFFVSHWEFVSILLHVIKVITTTMF